MGTTADKLSYLNDTKVALRASINNFEDSANPTLVNSETTFRDYSTKVDEVNAFTNDALSGYTNQLTEILGNISTGETPKEIIVNAVNARGGNINTSNTWHECSDEIKHMEAEWFPDHLWVDISAIIRNDPNRIENGGIYKGSYIVLSVAVENTQVFKLNSTTSVAIKTSDGSFYSFSINGADVTHSWNTESYVSDSKFNLCRWMIIYQSSNVLDIRYASAIGNTTVMTHLGYGTTGCLYVIFAVNLISNGGQLYNTASLFASNYTIESFDIIDPYTFTTSSNVAAYFLNTCYSIQKIPFEKMKNFTYSNNSFSTVKLYILPDIVCNSFGGSFGGTSIQEINSLTISGGGYLSQSSLGGIRCINFLDMSGMTSNTGEQIFSSLFALRHCLCKIPPFSVKFNSAVNLDYESWVYMCDNAPDVTLKSPSPILTLGAVLQGRVGVDNLAKLTTKGWIIA